MNKTEIRELMRFFDKSNITKVKIKDGEFSIELQKGFDSDLLPKSTVVAQPAAVTPSVESAPVESAPAAAPSKAAAESGDSIKSPMVGTFYVAPSPGSEPFAKVGSIIQKGEPVAVIEAMKIMNELEAEFTCKILEVLVEDGTPVEYGMPLFIVEKV
ncbi:acetyl-CoA carboxylase biotin carboxyl carrier protein [Sulfurospirillum sp. 1612]|uniref:acetyl-CoA carboxylase biotin carboxyl carrier protein n=1 Tax=Sulfurospirillum sp. 1612 TaxID=3094835 RepID=UPI002F94BBF2